MKIIDDYITVGQRYIYPQVQDASGKWVVAPGATVDLVKFDARLATIPTEYSGLILLDVETWPLDAVNSSAPDAAVVAEFMGLIVRTQSHSPGARVCFYSVWHAEIVAACGWLTIPLYVGTDETMPHYMDRTHAVMARGRALGYPQYPLLMRQTKGGVLIAWFRMRRLVSSLRRDGAEGVLVWPPNGWTP